MKRILAALACGLVLTACGTSAEQTDEPGDPLRDRQWSLDLLDPDGEIAEMSTGSGVTVAMIDSGVDASHRDLTGRVDEGIDLVDPETPPDDGYGHGTHGAGIIAATVNNGVGIAGLAPDVRILPIRVLDDRGDGKLDDVAAGIRWATDQEVQVINLSIEASADDPQVATAVAEAVAANIVVVAAAGNRSCPDEGPNDPVYPAAYPGVIGVSTLNENNSPYPVSSCGPWVDLAAPGVAIVSIVPDSPGKQECREEPGECMLTGSSEAAPFVSAAAALRIAQVGLDSYSAAEVADDLQASAADIAPPGRDDVSGFGRLDVLALLKR